MRFFNSLLWTVGLRWRRCIVENGECGLRVLDQLRYVVVVVLRNRLLVVCFRLWQGQSDQLGRSVVRVLGFSLVIADLRQPRELSGQTKFLIGDAADQFEIYSSGLRVSRRLQ